MTAEVQQGFDHLEVALVDSDVQRRLPALVPGVQVGPAPLQDLDDRALVSEGCVMDGPVSVFVLDKTLRCRTLKTV